MNEKIISIIFFILIISKLNSQPQWIYYNPNNSGLPDWGTTDIAFDSLNNKWIGTAFGGLAKFNGSTWTIFDTLNSPIPSNKIYAVAIDKKNILWIATDKGVTKFDGINWVSFDSISLRYTNGIVIDNENNKWMSSYWAGLIKFNDTIWVYYKTDNSGIQTNALTGVALENNIKWISTGYNGLIKYNDTTFVNYTYSNSGIGSNYLRCISVDKNKFKWIGKQDDYAVKYDSYNNTWTNYNNTWPGLTGGQILYVFCDSRNIKWFGSNGGLFSFNDTTLFYHNPPVNGTIFDYFREDKYFNIWFCTANGLYVHNPNGIVSIKEDINVISDKFSVSQNYPNPFNSETKIKYYLSKNGLVLITLYDIVGRKISTILNEIKPRGNHESKFVINNLTSGIYYLKFDFDDSSITKRIILLK